ncbi:MAG: hypothetical protein KGJ80_16785, partial [Chloroflexota bacterium]|nr:hypothetical protein [Chloroflexota bacterium]
MMAQTTEARKTLWTVNDPRGLAISLIEDVWEDHVRKHPEIADYFEEIKLTAQEPDEIYFDPVSSARRQVGTSIYSYYRRNLGRGRFKGALVIVIVKSVQETSQRRGYVQSALLSDRVMK